MFLAVPVPDLRIFPVKSAGNAKAFRVTLDDGLSRFNPGCIGSDQAYTPLGAAGLASMLDGDEATRL